tara:strand:- start:644 stop:889 length:246 start_codon:yes stop_codon:yes gene_type:complete
MSSPVKEKMLNDIKGGGEQSPPAYIQQKQPIELKLDIRDTEFLLRLINNSGIGGSDIEQAYNTFVKLKHFHSVLLTSDIGV